MRHLLHWKSAGAIGAAALLTVSALGISAALDGDDRDVRPIELSAVDGDLQEVDAVSDARTAGDDSVSTPSTSDDTDDGPSIVAAQSPVLSSQASAQQADDSVSPDSTPSVDSPDSTPSVDSTDSSVSVDSSDSSVSFDSSDSSDSSD